MNLTTSAQALVTRPKQTCIELMFTKTSSKLCFMYYVPNISSDLPNHVKTTRDQEHLLETHGFDLQHTDRTPHG